MDSLLLVLRRMLLLLLLLPLPVGPFLRGIHRSLVLIACVDRRDMLEQRLDLGRTHRGHREKADAAEQVTYRAIVATMSQA
jgi:hypothetical protein